MENWICLWLKLIHERVSKNLSTNISRKCYQLFCFGTMHQMNNKYIQEVVAEMERSKKELEQVKDFFVEEFSDFWIRACGDFDGDHAHSDYKEGGNGIDTNIIMLIVMITQVITRACREKRGTSRSSTTDLERNKLRWGSLSSLLSCHCNRHHHFHHCQHCNCHRRQLIFIVS